MVKGDGGYKWSANLTYNVKKDGIPEGREWFWLYLDDPEVKKSANGAWESHSGSSNVPKQVRIEYVIEAHS